MVTMLDGFMTPYLDAGHDLESLFDVKQSNKCRICGAYLIDLSEDMVYGDVRKCSHEVRNEQ